MSDILTSKRNQESESQWLSISDLMAGLMVVFMFIAVAFMLNVQKDKDRIEGIAFEYRDTQLAIYEALKSEFQVDMNAWGADLHPETLTFTFRSPDILFQEGEDEINEKYSALLDEFAPRYFNILTPFYHEIKELRIEGHTSSGWGTLASKEAYFKNMDLSQKRTQSVLSHLYSSPYVTDELFVRNKLVAVGYSSSRPEPLSDKSEDPIASRRVSFTVITHADEMLKKIIRGAK